MTTILLEPAAARRSNAELTIDLDAVADNTRRISTLTSAAVMAVVKADGFGLGAVEVARTALAHGATWLGVTSLDEAVALRAAGIDAPVLSWLNPVDLDAALAVDHHVDLAVPSLEHLESATRVPGARLHLHLDTGLARDGADPRRWNALCRAAALAERRGIARVVGVMGHLACAEEPGHPANRAGQELFAWGVDVARRRGLRPTWRHLAATAATVNDPGTHHTLVRIGAGLVGIDPSGTTTLRSPVRLVAPVVQVRDVEAGTSVGYGHTCSAPRPTRLGLVAVGYGDGLPRAASGRAEVLVHGRRRAVVGSISMDQVVVDLGASSSVRAGDEVVLLGPGDGGEPTAHEWAAWSGTLPHEVLTGLGARPRRTVVA